MAISKKERQAIYAKTDGHCGYCGCVLIGGWQVDHIIPKGRKELFLNKIFGKDNRCNLIAACPECNRWKGVWTVEEFRNEISKQVDRARRYSRNFRMSERFGLIEETGIEVKFYADFIFNKLED